MTVLIMLLSALCGERMEAATCDSAKPLAVITLQDRSGFSQFEDWEASKTELFGTGKELLDERKFREALDYFNRVVESRPNDVCGYIGRASSRFELGNSNQAIEDCTHALQLDKECFVALRLRGFFYLFEKRFDEALADGERLLEIDQRPYFGLILVSLALAEKQMYNIAFIVLDRGITESEKPKIFRFVKAATCLSTEEYHIAQRELRAILETDPDNKTARSFLRDVLALTERKHAASAARARESSRQDEVAEAAKEAVSAQSNASTKWKKALEITNSVGMKLRLIPSGEFEMGSARSVKEICRIFDAEIGLAENIADEHPQHHVKISQPFYLSVTEVTQGQWKRVMGTRPWADVPSINMDSDCPAVKISWQDALRFCNKLSKREGLQPYYEMGTMMPSTSCMEGYRLPTEAEWEYACRAGTTTMYHFGDAASRLEHFAWFFDSTHGRVSPQLVGQKKPNAFGLYDMHGSVWEWCQDRYSADYYARSASTEPTGSKRGSSRVVRGGCWMDFASWCRSASRRPQSADGSGRPDVGFRVVRIVQDSSQAGDLQEDQ